MSGNWLHTNNQVTTPSLKFPIADKLNVPTSQQGRRCGFFETHFFKCLEGYGPKLGRKFCDLEYRDYRECVTNEKQIKRVQAMRREHWKQWFKGNRDTPFDDHVQVGEIRPVYYENELPA